MSGVTSQHGLSEPLTEGPWAGWSRWIGDEPFEEAVGPFYARREAGDAFVAGCRMKAMNLRSGGIAHGGMLMTFADFALFMIAQDDIAGQDAITVSMTSDFLAGAPAGSLLVARGDVLKRGRKLLFVRGVVAADETDVLAFSAVIKLIGLPRH